jgi:hypothetical protein
VRKTGFASQGFVAHPMTISRPGRSAGRPIPATSSG